MIAASTPVAPLEGAAALEFLEGYDLRVVRSAAVDSAEAAIAFAGAQAIALVADGRIDDGLTGAAAIRRAFEKARSRRDDERVVVRYAVAAGADAVVAGVDDPSFGREVILRCGTHEARRHCPLAASAAEQMLCAFVARHGAGGVRAAEPLVQLLVKASRMYLESGIDRFVLDPVRVGEDGYTILGARIWSNALPRRRESAAPRAGVYRVAQVHR